MNNLFQNNSEPLCFELQDAEIIYYPNFYDFNDANLIFKNLLDEIPWQQDDIRVYGKIYAQPRLTALFGNDGKPYTYSNIKMQPHPWNFILQKIKFQVENIVKENFTTVLLNLYRNGKDSNGWHADNEKELGTNPIIASLSFGAERFFYLQHNTEKNLKLKILLEHGSLLVMNGTTQHFWKHQIPKITKPIGNRINLTFRKII